MYYPYEGGTSKQIGFDNDWYTVYLPPVGYVYTFPKKEDGTTDYTDYQNGKLEHKGVLNDMKDFKDQKWQRPLPPANWKQLLAQEKRLQKQNPNAIIKEAQQFRTMMWDRRLHGCWVMIAGEPVYLTGLHFYHLNRKFDFGYPDFRFVDLDIAYFLQLIMEDPNCYGGCIATLRRYGKTAWASSFITEPTTRTMNYYAGMQGESDDKIKEQFQDMVVYPFKNDYEFWRPRYDTSSKQVTEVSFKATTTIGKNALDLEPDQDDSLYSRINYKNAKKFSYDSKKLHRYLREEPGKTRAAICNIHDAWPVVKQCLRQGNKIIGKALYPTTIEDAEEGGKEFVKLWSDSNPAKRDKNGRTVSGMYRLFVPAFKGYIFDEFGRSLEEQAKEEINNEREALKHDKKALTAYIRKLPFTFAEASMATGKKCEFNEYVLKQRLSYLQDIPEDRRGYTKGNFEWVSERDGDVRFETDWLNGKWLVYHLPEQHLINRVKKVFLNGKVHFAPQNDLHYRAATDPISHGQVTDPSASKAAGMVFWKFDSSVDDPGEDAKPNWKSRSIACMYNYRPDDPLEYFDDMIKMCRFYSCQIHIENVKRSIINVMNERNYSPFILNRPEHLQSKSNKLTFEEGSPASNDAVETMLNDAKTYINEHGHRLMFTELIEQLLDFDFHKRRDYDLVMCLFFLLAADKQYVAREPDPIPVADLFPTFDY